MTFYGRLLSSLIRLCLACMTQTRSALPAALDGLHVLRPKKRMSCCSLAQGLRLPVGSGIAVHRNSPIILARTMQHSVHTVLRKSNPSEWQVLWAWRGSRSCGLEGIEGLMRRA